MKAPVKVALPIKLHENQRHVHENSKRFNVILAGKRWGKSTFGLYRAIQKAGKPGAVVWVVCPTYRQAKRIAWWTLLELIPRHLILRAPETELMIEMVYHSRIYLMGADDEDSLRGPPVGHILMDEAAYTKEHIWPSILHGQLLGRGGTGTADFISSPCNTGRSWFEDFHAEARRKMLAGDPDWSAFFYTIWDNPTLDKKDIQKLRDTTPDDIWNLEYMANPSAVAGRLYSEFDPSIHVEELPKFSGKLVMGMDWGMAHPTVCLWIYVDQAKRMVYVQDEFVRTGLLINESASVIKEKTGDRAVEWRVIDPSTAKRNSQTGRRDMDEFARYGISCIPADNSSRGRDVTKMFFKKNMIKISPKCRTLIHQLKSLNWGDKEGDDCTDSLRYALLRVHDTMFNKIFDNQEVKSHGLTHVPWNLNDPRLFPGAAPARSGISGEVLAY